MTGTLVLLASMVLCGVVCWGIDRDRMRWKALATDAQRLLTNERASRESMEHQLNGFILRTHAAESKLEELWIEDCEERARPASLRHPVELTDEEARRVMLILFPERRWVGGGKVQ